MIRFTRTDNTETPYHIPNNIEIPLDDILLCILCKYEVGKQDVSQQEVKQEGNIPQPQNLTTPELNIPFKIVGRDDGFSKIVIKVDGKPHTYIPSSDLQYYFVKLSSFRSNIYLEKRLICHKRDDKLLITCTSQPPSYIEKFKKRIPYFREWIYDLYKVDMLPSDEIRIVFDYYDMKLAKEDKYTVILRINTYSGTINGKTYEETIPDYEHQFVTCSCWSKTNPPIPTHIAVIKYRNSNHNYYMLMFEDGEYSTTNKPNPDELIKLGFKHVE